MFLRAAAVAGATVATGVPYLQQVTDDMLRLPAPAYPVKGTPYILVLGDSVGAGQGIGRQTRRAAEHMPQDRGDCARSLRAPAELAANALGLGCVNLSCSGWTTQAVGESLEWVSDFIARHGTPEAVVLAGIGADDTDFALRVAAAIALSGGESLDRLGVKGLPGFDADPLAHIKLCSTRLLPESPLFDLRTASGTKEFEIEMTRRLSGLIADVVNRAAPAPLLLMGYPFDDIPVRPTWGLMNSDLTNLRTMFRTIGAAQQNVAWDLNATYVDTNAAFGGRHRDYLTPPDAVDAWRYAPQMVRNIRSSSYAPFHPNEQGAQALADVLEVALTKVIQRELIQKLTLVNVLGG